MPASPRAARCDISDARTRLRASAAYYEVAELVLDEQQPDEYLSVAAGLAVLAGIAAADCICCVRLGRRHRSEDHRRAAELLRGAVPDGAALATQLIRLLEIKDAAHYGVVLVTPRKARNALRWAGALVTRARDEVER
jgi:hypothetical protein